MINMSRAWDKEKKSEPPTGFEPTTCQTQGGRSIMATWARRTHKERGDKLGSYSYAKHTKLKTSRTNNIRAGSVFFLATVAMGVDVTAYDGSLPKPKQQFSAEKGIQSNHLDNSCA